jgi:hypothetical protein
MISRKHRAAFLLLKTAGLAGDAARGAVAAGKGFLSSGHHISKVMAEHGVESPLAHAAAKTAPYLAAAAGGKAVYESEPVQRLRYKYHMYKQRKAMEKAQRGY